MAFRSYSLIVLAAVLCQSATHSAAFAAPCDNANALGVSRTIVVDPRVTPAVGSEDYAARLPLAPGEVVLTFDDGPRPPYTNRVLKALADQCLQATFFMLGRNANANPGIARQVRAAGHTIGTHTQNHPMHAMSPQRAVAEINTGIASVGSALGSPRALAPFFRFPGLYRTSAAENYLRSRGIMVWSIDIDSYDYRHSSVSFMLQRMLTNLERRHGGILLMHDIQPKTAQALPALLAELKRRGFRIVHVVPAEQGVTPELIARSPGNETAVAANIPRIKHRRSHTKPAAEAVAQPVSFDAAFYR